MWNLKKLNTQEQSRTVITRDGKMSKMGRCWSKSTKLQLYRIKKSRDSMYNMISIVNNTILNTGNLLRK